MEIESISVIGLGKLGSCIAAVLAYKGFNVIGVDVDIDKVKCINRLEPPVYEPGLAEVMAKTNGRLKATTDYSEAVSQSNATFIVVPTPSMKSGRFSLQFVKKAINGISKTLKEKKEFHLVVLNSTVSPGSMDGSVKPFLEKMTGKKCGKELGLCYNPEFIALGNVVQGLLKPDLVLIGESDPMSGALLEQVYSKVCENNPPIERMNFINAEIVKLSINSYITMKISFANMLAELCEKIPGGDVDVVSRAVGRDSRIGPKYLKGGLGYGGPCFPRDNRAFVEFAKRYGVNALLPKATDSINKRQIDRVVRALVNTGIKPPSHVAVLGLAYKPDTNVIEESQGLLLAAELSKKGYRVSAYDPAAGREASKALENNVKIHESLQSCLEEAEAIIIATPWREFEDIPLELLKNKPIIDCWRTLKPKVQEGAKDLRYIPLGVYTLSHGK